MKTINYFKTGILAITTLVAMNSCSVATDNIEVEQKNQTFEFEDVMTQVDINSETTFYATEGVTSENIQKATITSIELSKNDSLSFSEVESIAVSIMSDDIDMVSVALLNPIPEGSKTISLEFAEEVDIAPFIKAGDFYLIMDAGFKNEDFSISKKMDATIKYNIEVSK